MGGTTGEGDGRAFDWGAFVSCLVHPTKVSIVEAMRWIERPLSAKELEGIFFGQPDLALIGYHLRQLVKVGVIARVGQRQVRGAVQTFYFLTDRFDPDPAA